MKCRLLYFMSALFLFFASIEINAQKEIDGIMFDWDESDRIDNAFNNDTQGRTLFFGEGDPRPADTIDASYKRSLDIGPIYADDDEEFLYLRVKLNPLADVTTIPTDTTINGGASFFVWLTMDLDSNIVSIDTTGKITRGDTTGFGYNGYWASAYDQMLMLWPSDSAAEANTDGQQYIWQNSLSAEYFGTFWGWSGIRAIDVADSTVGVYVAWTGDNNDVECAIPKSIFANPKFLPEAPSLAAGDSIGLMYHFQENNSPWYGNFICNGDAGWNPGNAYGVVYKWKTTYTSVGIKDKGNLPFNYNLSQNFPNPFNPVTRIKYSIGNPQFVTIKVYNVLGNEVATLVNEYMSTGEHEINFDASKLSSGVYFYELSTGSFTDTKKLMLIK